MKELSIAIFSRNTKTKAMTERVSLVFCHRMVHNTSLKTNLCTAYFNSSSKAHLRRALAAAQSIAVVSNEFNTYYV